ncbi:MAG: 3-deoxy-D-manno-octulosonic acid transferase [Cytophagales bacterium]|nr:3-deoxy-D-manno-octulosonic acid transferase [Cytophagales bacterium]
MLGKAIYNLSMALMSAGLSAASVFNPRARQFTAGRKGLFRRIEKELGGNKQPVIWFHCASLGEFEQARPVMERFRKENPTYKIVLTFFSPSGYEVRKDYGGADYIFYLPLDSSSNARRFLDLVRPRMVCFVKYEFWYHYLNEVHSRGIPLVIFSAIFRKDQIFFKRHGAFNRKMLHFFDRLFVQNQESVDLLRSVGVETGIRVGDTRFDRVKEISEQAKPVPAVDAFIGNSEVMIVGSSWMSDMEVLFPLINRQLPNLKFIIAPHNIRENELSDIENGVEASCIRYSKTDPAEASSRQVLLIDNIGMLSSLYRYADYAYVGGAFNKGLHNTAEAAVYGCPVFFGHDQTNRKFKEAVDLVHAGGAFEVSDAADLTQKFEALYNDKTLKKNAGERSKAYIEENLGATARIVEYLNQKGREA